MLDKEPIGRLLTNKILINIYFKYMLYIDYIMGTYNSRYELEDFNPTDNRSCYQHPKNFDYWFTKDRFTYISRKHYVNDFVSGFLWGRYPKKNSIDIVIDDDEGERESGYDL